MIAMVVGTVLFLAPNACQDRVANDSCSFGLTLARMRRKPSDEGISNSSRQLDEP